MRIHPTAVIEKGAELGEDVTVGAYCVIGAKAKIGAGAQLYAHVMVDGATEIGPRTIVHSFAAIGGAPQHLAYRGENTRLIIGADNVIREHVTMNIGSPAGRGETRIGDKNFIMVGCHVAHDCLVGDGIIMANNATLGGHVTVGDHAFLGGLSAIHQFCRIGAQAFVGGCAMVTTDIVPYGLAIGNHAHLAGLNIVGMKRRGMSRERIHALRRAYRALFSGEGTFQERLKDVEARYGARPEVRRMLDFVKTEAKRPLMTPAR
ncbi:MAG: acyl-ACP--UDP-N-acetylglucosamine O-acyltransferase [Amphiplicatus sp.]